MQLDIYTGPPGCGKTSHLLRDIGERPGRYLLAVPALHLIGEHCQSIEDAARKAGQPTPLIVEVHSGPRRDGSGPALPRRMAVSRVLQDAANLYKDQPRVVVVTTHSSMMHADLSRYQGWHAVLDEAPASIAAGHVKIPAAVTWLASMYDLQPLPGSDCAMLQPRPGRAMHVADLRSDDYLSGLADLDRRARSPAGVMVDLQDWADARSVKRAVSWISAWTPSALKAFDSVHLAAAGYFESLGHLISCRIDGAAITHKLHDLAAPAHDLPARRVRIRYFVDDHTGSTAWWTDAQGAGPEALRKIGWWLAEHASSDHYWSANNCLIPTLLACQVSGQQVAPRIAGTNRLRNCTTATMIYSAKPTDQDAPLRTLLGLRQEEILRAREHEDLVQFVLRGALRRPEWIGDYTVHLYSSDQAAVVRAYILQHGLAGSVTLEHIPLGLEGLRERSSSWRTTSVEAESWSARQARRRAQSAELMGRLRAERKQIAIAAGTYRPRGRPPVRI